MSAVVPKSGFEERLALLKIDLARVQGQIAEVEFWLELCAKAEAVPVEAVEEPEPEGDTE